MERDSAAYDDGIAEAMRDIALGHFRWFSGAPLESRWGCDLAETLHSKFAITVKYVSCLVNVSKVSHEEGYNSAIEAHVDSIWGLGALAAALAEVKRRREEGYDAWFAAQGRNGEKGT